MGKWIFNKHTKKMEALDMIITSIASKRTGSDLVANSLVNQGLYKPRGNVNKTTISNKFKELQFYNFAYINNSKYMLSTLGNYYYKGIYTDNIEMKEDAFINTLFNVQFPHSYNKSESNVYPFRLIFKLMTEKKLDSRLYNNEILVILYDFEFASEHEEDRKNEYDVLVEKILEYRKMDRNEKLDQLEQVDSIADRIHQLDYYVMSIFCEMNAIKPSKNKDIAEVKFYHPQNSGSKSKPTPRKYIETSYSITKEKKEYISQLLSEMKAYAPILSKDDMLESDYIQIVFNAVSDAFLNKYSSDESTGAIRYVKELTGDVIYHSNNEETDSANIFEIKLCDLFNMFEDVKAERISGAGKTDVECYHYTSKNKFNLEAKSTGKKLMQINSGRLKQHMNISKSKYTMVVAPDFAPSATKYDILGTDIVAIRASVLCEYIQNMALNNNFKYTDLNEIVLESLGEDISTKVLYEISNQFGVVKENFL